ncbi:MAG: nucleoside deaminase [Eubacteriales bacterium]|nr:nucleoside deaminase [Eubacteriales bacterium]
MRIALEQAHIAVLENEVPVGALIVHQGEIIACSHNRCRQLADESQHAEMLVLKQAKSRLGSLDDCTLYVTMEPCAMCAGAMVHYKLPKLVFGAYDVRCGCCGSRIDLTDHWFYHSIETLGGIYESECVEILSEFFKQKR